MKANFQDISLADICLWFGISRQAYYQKEAQQMQYHFEEDLIIEEVQRIRKQHPFLGVRKLYILLKPFMQERAIKMGRDGLFDLLSEHFLLIRKRKRNVRTTHSHHWLKKYPNLIRNKIPMHKNELWVSDITYWKTGIEKYLYISLITDAYSHKIVGYHVGETLNAAECLRALRKAILWEKNNFSQLVHHSDRGIQYCSQVYTKLLKKYAIFLGRDTFLS